MSQREHAFSPRGHLGHEVEVSRQKAATADTKAQVVELVERCLHFSSRLLTQSELHSPDGMSKNYVVRRAN